MLVLTSQNKGMGTGMGSNCESQKLDCFRIRLVTIGPKNVG